MITITVGYLPGSLNHEADQESQVYNDSRNLQMDTAFFTQLQA